MSSKVLSVRTSASSKGRGIGTDMTMGGTGRSRLETSNDVVWGYVTVTTTRMVHFADFSPPIVFLTLPSPIMLCRDGDSDTLIDIDNPMNIKLDCRCSKRPTHISPH